MTCRILAATSIVVYTAAAAAVERPAVLTTYALRAGTRPISGVSRELEWLFVPVDAERAQMKLRVPIDSFSSGDVKFDIALRRAIDSRRHPDLVIVGVAQEGRLDGTLELGGVAREVAIRLHRQRAGGSVIAIASVAIDLRDFGVHLDGVEPRMSLEMAAGLVVSPDAVLAGGWICGDE